MQPVPARRGGRHDDLVLLTDLDDIVAPEDRTRFAPNAQILSR
ncbi:hypothetical protein ACIRD6_03410 [Streptomyces sp. NPDC102473]